MYADVCSVGIFGPNAKNGCGDLAFSDLTGILHKGQKLMDSSNIENELDQYGVWVKTPPHNAQDVSSNPDTVSAPGDLFTDDLTLPPMEKTVEESTESVEPEHSDVPVDENLQDVALPEGFDMESLAGQFENADLGVDIEKKDGGQVPSETEKVEEKTVSQETSSEMPSFEDGEIDLDAFLTSDGDGEVSLDSFFDSPSDSGGQMDGDISLDAFLDVSDFGLGGNEKQENTAADFDEPLDIDLVFEDTVVEEDDGAEESFDDFEAMFESANSSDSGGIDISAFTADSSEGIDLDNFDAMFDSIEDSGDAGKSETPAPKTSVVDSSVSFGDSESIDLSEFNLSDEDSGNIKLGGDDIKPKVPVVQDYDLDIGEDFMDSDVGGAATEDNLELNMDLNSTGPDTLKQDEENPFSAPDSDFDVDSLFDSIVDETGTSPVAPKTENPETVEVEKDLEMPSVPDVDMQMGDSLAADQEEMVDAGEKVEEIIVNDSTADEFSVADEDITKEIGETVESGSASDTESTENMAETREDSMAETETAENEIDKPVFNGSDEVVQTEIPETSEETSVGEDSVDLDNFMGEEGFSDPSICEGNRSYSPEELEEQERAKQQAELNETVAEEKKEEESEDFASIDQTLVVDASEGGTSNDVMDDDEVIPEPFYTPLVETEGNATENFKEAESEGFSLNGVDIVPADMKGLSYDENGGIAPLPVESSEETVAEIENQVDNNTDTIPDNGDEKMDSTNSKDEFSETKSLISQIAQELSLLRSEINELKTEFAEIKKGNVSAPVETSTSDSEKESGFFSDMDDDDTIALSGDELSNILSTAEFTPANEDQPEESILGSVVGAADVPDQEYENNLTMDFDSEKLEEPNLDSVQLVENSREPEDESDEIETPKVDDVLVESEGTEYISADNASDEIVLEPVPETREALVEDVVDEADVGDPLESDVVAEETSESEAVENADLEQAAADETVEESVAADDTVEQETFEEPAVGMDADESSESIGEPVVEESSEETEVVAETDETVETESTEETASEPVFEEPTFEESDGEPVFDEPVVMDDSEQEETSEEITLPVPETEASEIERSVEVSEEESVDTFEEPQIEADAEPAMEESVVESTEESFEEPEVEETVEEDSVAEETTEETVAEEPAVEESVETEDSGFEAPLVEDELDQQVDNSISEENYDYLSDDSEIEEDEKIETGISEEPVNNVFDAWESKSDETAADETVVEDSAEETVAEEEPTDASLDEPVDETPVSDEIGADDLCVAEEEKVEDSLYTGVVDDEVNEVPVGDAIVSEPSETVVAGSGVSSIPEEMKQEIKSVLAYMDQLLESLPEDKIAEFAQSEQFSTYKKLFTELGLS